MKKIALVFAFAAIGFAASAQDGAFTQGSSTVSVGYGLGNIWKTLFKMGGAFSGGAYKVTSAGPFAAQYEYGVSDRISVGVALGYAKVTGTYDDKSDPSSNYKESLTSMSGLIRGNYHFGHSEKFDPYIGIGVGYFNFKYDYKDANGNTDNSGFAIPTALGYSGQLGAKYYFSDKIGAYAEIGYVGGSLAQIGLTAKF